MALQVNNFLCPSDGGGGDGGWTGGTNYRANLGTQLQYVSMDGPFMMAFNQLSSAAMTDGSSNTVMFSEKLRGRRTGARLNARTDIVLVPYYGSSTSPTQYLDDCTTNSSVASGYLTYTGLTWFVSDMAQTNYNHGLGPNSIVPDCAIPGVAVTVGFVDARSNHPGGVQATMADGSVRFVTESIRRSIWKALGTRNGNEITSADQF